MGAWEELDTLITVDVDNGGLDTLQELDDPYNIFDGITDYVDKLKNALNTAGYKIGNDLSIRNRSFQEQAIRENCDNPSGMLASSINIEESSSDEHSEFLIGTIINHIDDITLILESSKPKDKLSIVVNRDGKEVKASARTYEEDGKKIWINHKRVKLHVAAEELYPEDYDFYLDLRKYGSARHAGFGLGFERCVMYLTGIGNIRDVVPFPRTVGTCDL